MPSVAMVNQFLRITPIIRFYQISNSTNVLSKGPPELCGGVPFCPPPSSPAPLLAFDLSSFSYGIDEIWGAPPTLLPPNSFFFWIIFLSVDFFGLKIQVTTFSSLPPLTLSQ